MQSTEEKTRIQQLLLDMFSNATPDEVLAVCQRNQWNAENCIDYLLINKSKDSENNLGAIPKCGAKLSKNRLYKNVFSPLEQEVIDIIRSAYRVMIIMRGAPGSGKSSLARSIVKESIPNFEEFNSQDFIFSADDYFYDNNGYYEYKVEKLTEAHASSQKRVKEKALSGWSPIIVDNTNMQIWEMIPYIKVALQNNYIIHILEPRTSWKNSPEKLATHNSHGVPRDKIKNMLNKYETATIGDIIKTIKDVNISDVVPRIRNFPPVQQVQKSKDVNIIPPNLCQKHLPNVKLNNNLTQDNSEKFCQAPKAQRNNFSKKPSKAPESVNTVPFINGSSEEIKKKPEGKFFELLKESVSNLPRNAIENVNQEICLKSSFERHTVDCPNENQAFALLRRVYDTKSISGLWDLFVKCDGNIDWAVDILLKEDDTNNIYPIENKIKDSYECNCCNVDLILKQNGVKHNKNSEIKENSKQLRPNPSLFNLEVEKQRAKTIIEKKFVLGEQYQRKHYRTSSQLTRELVDVSTQTDIFNEKESNHEMVEINFDANIIAQMNEIFQSESLENEGFMLGKNTGTNVFLPRTFAKDLYMLCMEAIYNKMEEERLKTIREDENFAKLIQNLEYENVKAVPNDTQDLDDLKMAFQFLGMDLESNKRLKDVERNPMNLATHLTLLKLTDEFPDTPSEILLDILQAQNNNYNDTIKVLLGSEFQCDLDLSKETFQNEMCVEKPFACSTNTPKNTFISGEEAKRLALSKFEESRNLAVHHCQLKGECYQKAKEMVQKGNSAVAVYYSHIANMHKKKIEMYNQCAANSIVEVHKYSKNNPDLLDLHYLHVAEALGCLDLFLDRHILNFRHTSRTYKNVFIITGRGLHSSGGISTIKNKVKNRLKERSLRWNEVNPGLLKVKLFLTSRYSK